ncbi:MAG: MGMT family protein [Candidatus Aenigmarchaeota archaeon]|nr:MGMT family protein [Candidatus Aenigmarchaeota archaeon]
MCKREIVFKLLKKVPRDKVTTYAELARAAGTHPRAVAVFMRDNRDPANVPCFRVVRSSGEVGGYSAAGGAMKKADLLEREGIRVTAGKVDLARHLHRF